MPYIPVPTPRVFVYERPPRVMELTDVEPDKPFYAALIKGEVGNEKRPTRVIASVYGRTEEEARAALAAQEKPQLWKPNFPAPKRVRPRAATKRG